MEPDSGIVARKFTSGRHGGRKTGYPTVDTWPRLARNRILWSVDHVWRSLTVARLTGLRIIGSAPAKAKQVGNCISVRARGSRWRAPAYGYARIMAIVSILCSRNRFDRLEMAVPAGARRVCVALNSGWRFCSASET